MRTPNARRIALGLAAGLIAVATVPALSATSPGRIAHASLASNTIVSGEDVQVDWAWTRGTKVSSKSLVNVARTSGGRWTSLAKNVPIRAGGVTWNTTQVPDASYTVQLRVVGTKIKAIASNLVVDNTAPEIAITRPTQTQILIDDESPTLPVVAGSTTLEAAAFDANGIAVVEWFLDTLDSEPIGTGATTVYDFSASPGPHTVFVTATDLVGLASTASIDLVAAPGPNFLLDGALSALPEPPDGDDPPETPGLPDPGETPDLPDLGETPDPGLPETPDPDQDPPALPDTGDLPNILPTP